MSASSFYYHFHADDMIQPTLYNVVSFVALGLALYLVLRFIYNISSFHPLSPYPGPLWWCGSRVFWVLALQRGILHKDLLRFHARYGPIIRVAPNELSYTDPRASQIYLTNPRSIDPATTGPVFERNSVWFTPLRPNEPLSIMNHNEADHARYRRSLMPAFTDKAVQNQFSILQTIVSDLMAQLRKQGTQPVDFTSWFNFLTFDVSGQLTFGETFGCVSSGKAHPWVDININFGKGVALMASLHNLGLSSGPMRGLIKYLVPQAVRERMMYHRALSAEKVQQKLAAGLGNKRADFMEAVLQTNETCKPSQQMSEAEMGINLAVVIFAGSETTSTTLTATLSALLRWPSIMQRLTHEIRTTFQSEADMTLQAVSRLEYLTAVISEALRLYPPIPYALPRVVPKDGAHICGRFVPAGVSEHPPGPTFDGRYPLLCLSCTSDLNFPQTFVALQQFPTNYSAENFSSPATFDPDRFLPSTSSIAPPDDKSPDKCSINNLEAFHPFLLGRHHCLGYKLAWAEMRLVITRLLWTFDLSLAPGMGGLNQKDFAGQRSLLFWQKEGLWVNLKPR